jgi:hypothetical protein
MYLFSVRNFNGLKLMKHILTLTVSIAIVTVALRQAAAQGTAFTYQGRLNDGGAPATGTYDLQFALFSVSSGGSAVAGPVTNSGVAVSNGLFSVLLDFGSVPFSTGAQRWLELGARTNGGGTFLTLGPRQQLTATPYAITAGNLTGALPNAGLSGTYTTPVVLSNAANAFSGSGAGLTLVNAASLGGLSAAQFWQLSGNNVGAAQFLGSTNNRTLELRANNQAALRLVPNPGNPPNVIGGSSGNAIASGSYGSVIGGGDSHFIDVNALNATIAGGENNNIQANSLYSSIGGGQGNQVFGSVEGGTISGGEGNFIWNGASDATIGGGTGHTIQSNALSATISGGQINYIGLSSSGGAIGGGNQNRISDFTTNATLAGGQLNTVSDNYSTIGGGSLNTIFSGAPDATIVGGIQNQIQPGASESSVGGGESNTVGTNSSFATIAGGLLNRVLVGSAFGVIGGGEQNTISNGAFGAVIAGGEFNGIQSNATLAAISGGDHNIIQTSCNNSVIGGGGANVISNLAVYSTIPGGSQNLIAGQYSFAAGRVAQALNQGCFVWSSSASGTPTTSVLDNSVTFRAPNGYRLFTASTGTTTGAQLIAGGTAWSSLSDRNAKKNIKPVDCQSVLDKLSHVPVEQWNYNWEDNSAVPHLGPMAQDFKGTFYPGSDDKMISTLEFDGVELAAIEGLNQKLEKELKEKEARISELEARLDRLEKRVSDSKRN